MEKSRGSFTGIMHAGIATFMRSPIVEPNSEALRKAGSRAAVLGFPFDGTCVSRTGTSYGPRALRDTSTQFISYHPSYDIDVVDFYRLVDCGDVPVVPGNAKRSLERGSELLGHIFASGAVPVLLGGEHLVSVSGTTAISKFVTGKVGLLVFDCHLDTANDVEGELLNHCCPWSRSMELPNLDGRNIAIIGVGSQNPKEEQAIADSHGVAVFTMEDVIEHGIESVTKDAIRIVKAGTQATYVSVDIDAVDGAYAPGTGVPTPGGLTSREILRGIRLVGSAGFDALDMVEVAPTYDHSGITSVLACRIIIDALAANAKRMKESDCVRAPISDSGRPSNRLSFYSGGSCLKANERSRPRFL